MSTVELKEPDYEKNKQNKDKERMSTPEAQADALVGRCRNVDDYFRGLDRYVQTAEWTDSEVASFLLSVNGPHTDLPFLHVESYGSRTNRPFINDEAIDQITCLHLHVLYNIYIKRNFQDAFKLHIQIMSLFNKEILQKRKEENWFMPIFYRFCSDLRGIARMADECKEEEDNEVEEIEGPNDVKTYYERCAEPIMEAYRTCVTDTRPDYSVTKKIAQLNMTNQLFRIYFKINKLNLLKPLIRSIDNAGPLFQYFSMADKVTYNYFLGRKAMFDSDLPLAEKSLTYAFRNCPRNSERNKKLILIYLIPVKMFLGHMPSKALLHKYQLDEFVEVVEAVKEGNFAQLERALKTNEDFFIQCGIFLMLEKLRGITFRTLFKKVSLLMGTNMIPLAAFSDCLKFLKVDDVDEDELECIIANLIAEKKIKGYLSHQHKKLVISKKDPFPALSKVHSNVVY